MKGLLIPFLLIFSQLLYADDPKVFDGFWKNTSESFTKNGSYHLAAIALTPALIYSDTDAHVHRAFRGSSTKLFELGDVMGYVGPFALGVPLYVLGKKNAAYAVTQSSIITLATVSLLKGVTGRHPPRNKDSKSPEWQSRQFYFGVLNRGIFNGWPSGHMAMVTSLASTMMHYYPEHQWVQYAGYGSMAYLLATISIRRHGEMHWFSDGVAGGLMGFAVGKTVGTNMRGGVVDEKSGRLVPMLGPQLTGVQIVWYR